MTNLHYSTANIAQFFVNHRIRWEEFYESERKIIGLINPNSKSAILDIGCGCGGLGLALAKRFDVKSYVGIEINSEAARAGNAIKPGAILHGDFLELKKETLKNKKFDIVFSLSCIDWNVEFDEMLHAAWEMVAPGGSLVATFRLTDLFGTNDVLKSYQYINYDGVREGEIACYVVLNASELFKILKNLEPSSIAAFGYWGLPSNTAVTPYEKLCFAAISISKPILENRATCTWRLDLPKEILTLIDWREQIKKW